MFMNWQKENQTQKLSHFSKKVNSLFDEYHRSDKKMKINQLRQFYTGETLTSKMPLQKFVDLLKETKNNYSLVLTLFDMVEDPLWRNKMGHICLLIKKLHNVCVQTYGSYLMQLAKIDNYHNKLLNIFYLNSPQIQAHFKLLIMTYLSYNPKFGILNEEQISIGLIDSCRCQKQILSEYLWIVCQIRTCFKTIIKVVKIGEDCINSDYENKAQILLPTITILSNYIVYEGNLCILEELMDCASFQRILMFCINEVDNFDLKRQTILLCNNILAKSINLSMKLLSSEPLISIAASFQCQQQQIFNTLLHLRRQQIQKQ